jgi:DNA-binding PadR family transcriptional regulator
MPNSKISDITTKEEAILRSLYRQALYGLEIARVISNATNNTIKYNPVSLYPTLREFEKKGWIIPRWGDELEGVRRKYYQITKMGKAVIENRQLFLNRLAIVDVDLEK